MDQKLEPQFSCDLAGPAHVSNDERVHTKTVTAEKLCLMSSH